MVLCDILIFNIEITNTYLFLEHKANKYKIMHILVSLAFLLCIGNIFAGRFFDFFNIFIFNCVHTLNFVHQIMLVVPWFFTNYCLTRAIIKVRKNCIQDSIEYPNLLICWTLQKYNNCYIVEKYTKEAYFFEWFNDY